MTELVEVSCSNEFPSGAVSDAVRWVLGVAEKRVEVAS